MHKCLGVRGNEVTVSISRNSSGCYQTNVGTDMCRTRRDERWCRIKINPAFPELTAQIFSEFWRLTGSFRASILP